MRLIERRITWDRTVLFHIQVLAFALILVCSLIARNMQGATSISAKKGRAPQRQWKEAAPTANSKTSLKNWAIEEVPFISTELERKQFQGLNTRSEQEEFINKFWERRNPIPGSSRNKFKEEYYRRLAYAKQHFSYLVKERVDDRGRIYIQFGPPDAISALLPDATENSSAEKVPLPFSTIVERWKYNHIEGISGEVTVEFDDPAGNGNYHVLVDPLTLIDHTPSG